MDISLVALIMSSDVIFRYEKAGLLTILFKSMAIIDSDTVENSIADTDTDTHAKKYRRYR